MRTKALGHNGFSLVEIMLALAGVAGISLMIMQLGKNSLQTQSDAISSADYFQLEREARFIISDGDSCTASLAGTTFNGATINGTPVTGRELWTADQTGARSQKRIFEGQKFGKLTLNTVAFSMPDYSGATNFAASPSQTLNSEILIDGAKGGIGFSKKFDKIKQLIKVEFSTDGAGLSTIISCNKPAAIPDEAIDWY